MSQLAADVDNAVKNGGELLDRLIKDIVTEQASTFVSARPTTPDQFDSTESDDESIEGEKGKEFASKRKQQRIPNAGRGGVHPVGRKAFSLARFVPLLSERIYVINPFTRTYLVSWLTVLDSIPELELVSYLPSFLDGLLKFLGDPTEDIRNASMHVLTGFLREIREAAEVRKVLEEARISRNEKRKEMRELRKAKAALKAQKQNQQQKGRAADGAEGKGEEQSSQATSSYAAAAARPGSRRQSVDAPPALNTSISSNGGPPSPTSTRTAHLPDASLDDISEEDFNASIASIPADLSKLDGYGESDLADDDEDTDTVSDDDATTFGEDDEGEGSGSWVPGQGVLVDHAAIVEILLQHLSFPDEEIQETCLRWISEFLLFAKERMVAFTPRLIPVILSSLAHHVPAIRAAALQTNYNLFKVVQQLPSPPTGSSDATSSPTTQTSADSANAISQLPAAAPGTSPEMRMRGHGQKESISSLRGNVNGSGAVPFPTSTSAPSLSSNRITGQDKLSTNNLDALVNDIQKGAASIALQQPEQQLAEQKDPFDYQATVNALTLQFLNENEETRVAALQWLSMLHQKAPKRVSHSCLGLGIFII